MSRQSSVCFCILSIVSVLEQNMGSSPGSKVYRNAILAGSLGFITFGWDAGVLGGILLTPEFQNTIGVGFL